MMENNKNSVSNPNCRGDIYVEFMSSEHIAELENAGDVYSIDLINKLHAQIKRRASELETGNLFELDEALGKEFWEKLSVQERDNAHFCWCYLVEFFEWSVGYYFTASNIQYYLFESGWSDCCTCHGDL